MSAFIRYPCARDHRQPEDIASAGAMKTMLGFRRDRFAGPAVAYGAGLRKSYAIKVDAQLVRAAGLEPAQAFRPYGF